jgi:hypothetical protein
MAKSNKRPHKVDEKADTPITSNNKKQDDKNTPTKTTPSENEDGTSEILPKLLNYEDDDSNKTIVKDNTATKKIENRGFTSIEWCASGIRCRNDKYHSSASRNPKYCPKCKVLAHPECLCEQGCLTCNKNIVWNSYTNRWVKLTTSTNDSSLQKASIAESIHKFGSAKWCGSKELCRNQLIPANGDQLCSICLTAVHSECIKLGEDDSDFICVRCNSKTQSTTIDTSLLPSDNDIVVITDDGSIITGSNNVHNIGNMNSKSNTMEVEDTIVDVPHDDNNKPMETIDEDQQVTLPDQTKPKKPSPVARGSGRITKTTNNHNRPRPNRSTKQGDFIITRFELRVNINIQTTNNDNNLQKLRNHLVEIVHKLTETDNDLKIVPWKEQSVYEEIDEKSIPHNQPGINKFFNRIVPRSEGFTYADIRIKHKRASKDIINDISLWLSNNQHGLYFQTLQSEETVNIGWLLWSFRKIDSRKLEEEIWDLYGINIALKYQTIATSTTRGGSVGDIQQTAKALHIWTKKSDSDRAANLFNFTVYKDKAVHFPLGIVLRFIPLIGRMQDRLDQFRSAWSLQRTLNMGMEGNTSLSATSWEIVVLDQKKDPYDSLRKLIMGVESKRLIGEHLFLSVDVSYFRSNEVLFSFLPRHEHEARDFVANLVPFILNTYPGEAAKSFFHPEAIERAQNSFWDSEKQEVVTIFDKYMEDFEILDDYAEDFILKDKFVLQGAPSGQAMSKVERILAGQENDSIGTVMTSATSTPPNNAYTSVVVGTSGPISNTINVASTPSTTTRSVATTMSQAQMETNIIHLNNCMSTIESVVLLMAQSMKVDISSVNLQSLSNTTPNCTNLEATATSQESGCEQT